MADPLSVALVTPFAWEDVAEVNEMVRATSDALAARGHRVLVIAPSRDHRLVRESRKAIRANAGSLFSDDGAPRILGVGEVLDLTPSRRRAPSVPLDVARTLEAALAGAPLDIVHVFEPWAPSAASAALRHSRALNVGTFHAPTERVLSTQLGRKVVERLFGRLDARVASFEATAQLLNRYFPGNYRTVTPGAPDVEGTTGERATFSFSDEEERGALRVFLRALRRLPADLAWSARICTERTPPPIGPRLRERIEWTHAPGGGEVEVFASTGVAPAPAGVLRARAAQAIPLVPRLPIYEELEPGLLFEPGDVDVLAAQLERLARDPELRQRLRQELAPPPSWASTAEALERVYTELTNKRHDDRGDQKLRTRLRGRSLIDVDLHMHTDHSGDCATPVEVLLAEAKSKGLGAIAVTDHNEIAGAHEARAKADGIKVIVGEEVKTADQGEVIGLFIEEKIPRGMSLSETIAEIKRQGGVVYVPHPFDRMHSVPDYEHLLSVLDDVDAIEVFNPRVAIGEFNEEAVRFAAKYRIPGGAGSDAHVAQGLGSVRIRMRDFDGPEEFLESLREADVIRTPANLLFVQALKFLQTTALPPPARKAVRDRRVRRAARKS